MNDQSLIAGQLEQGVRSSDLELDLVNFSRKAFDLIDMLPGTTGAKCTRSLLACVGFDSTTRISLLQRLTDEVVEDPSGCAMTRWFAAG